MLHGYESAYLILTMLTATDIKIIDGLLRLWLIFRRTNMLVGKNNRTIAIWDPIVFRLPTHEICVSPGGQWLNLAECNRKCLKRDFVPCWSDKSYTLVETPSLHPKNPRFHYGYNTRQIQTEIRRILTFKRYCNNQSTEIAGVWYSK